MLDESGITGFIAFWFQRSSDLRVGLLCVWNVDIRGEQAVSITVAPIDTSQVLTGLRPFYHLHAYSPVFAVVRGERPEKPLDAESLGFSDGLWELVQLCWSELSSARPTAQRLFDHLSEISLTWVPPLVYPAPVLMRLVKLML